MNDEERFEHTYLHTSGPIPGFPGAGYGPGPAILDKLERKVYSPSEWEAMQEALSKEAPEEKATSSSQPDVL
jgi:hypothetical protein